MCGKSSCQRVLVIVSVALVAWLAYLAMDEPYGGIPTESWDMSFSLTPRVATKAPDTLEYIVAIVKAARKNGESITTIGSGHSFSLVQKPSDIALSLHRFSGVVNVDHERKRITVRGGTILRDVYDALEELGWTLATMGDYTRASVAGALATGTHGSTLKHGSMATLITDLQIVTGTGEVINASRNENPEIFNAARVGVGMLGVITMVTLQAEEAFNLHEVQTPAMTQDCVDYVNQLAHSAEYVKLWLFVEGGLCQIFRANRTTSSEHQAPSLVVRRMESALQRLTLTLTEPFPTLKTWATRLFLRHWQFTAWEHVTTARKILTLPTRAPPHTESEFAVPMKHVGAALADVVELIKRDDVYADMVTVVRFGKADDIWMSAAYGTDVCYITGLSFSREPENLKRYFQGLEKIAYKYEGRPHWGKYFDGTENDFGANFPKLADFVKVKRRLDPNRVFRNEKLSQMISSAYD